MVKYYWINQAAGHGIIKLMDRDEIARLGASLRLIDRRLLSPSQEEGTRRVWYQGGEPYFDLFVELRQGKIEWFQFTLRGQSLSWNPRTCNWQTGRTNEMRTDDITFYPASKVIEGDKQPDPQFIEVVRSILQTRAGEKIFDQILTLFDRQDGEHPS
ncbi:MAG: hypothetical protein Fur006_56220 [Coleofasciculaceae cyanobacterium]|jgi:hypothetical protein